MHFSAAEEGLGDWLRAPAKARRRAMRAACPSTCRSPQPAESATHRDRRLRSPRLPAADRAGPVEDEFEVWVVTDACGSRTERNRDAAFDRLAGAGAELVTTEMVGFEWLRTAEHPRFQDFQTLIR